MRARDLAVCLGVLLPDIGQADGITLTLYPEHLDGHVRFDTLPRRDEPGHVIDQLYLGPDVALGSHFKGQTLGTRTGPGGQQHDTLTQRRATPPLHLLPGAPGQSLSVAWHRGFGSMALFPLGPSGFPRVDARGEGAVSILFETDQDLIGLRIHSGYSDPLGQSPRPGAVHVTCLSRSAEVRARIDTPLATGITEIGLQFDTGPIAGCTLTNTDPGGIAIDDLRYRLHPLLG